MNILQYVVDKYGTDAIQQFEEDYGTNGRDLLLSLNTPVQIDDLLKNYSKLI